jgi:hypothetical protein
MQKVTRPTADEPQTERRLWSLRGGCAYMRWAPPAWGYQGDEGSQVVQLESFLRIPIRTKALTPILSQAGPVSILHFNSKLRADHSYPLPQLLPSPLASGRRCRFLCFDWPFYRRRQQHPRAFGPRSFSGGLLFLFSIRVTALQHAESTSRHLIAASGGRCGTW